MGGFVLRKNMYLDTSILSGKAHREIAEINPEERNKMEGKIKQ